MEADPSDESEMGQSQAPTPPGQSDAGPGGWRLWIRPVFYVAYGLVATTATPLIILDIVRGSQGKEEGLAITLAGAAFFATVATLAISAWGIINHTVCYTRPAMQKYVMRILWIIPIFVTTSWFSLRFPVAGIYLESSRQLYQSFIVYNYVFYLATFFQEVPDFDSRLAAKPQVGAPRPLCWLKATPSLRLIKKCKYGVLSYKIIRIVFTIIALTTFHTKNYLEGWFSPDGAYLWVTIFLTVFQIWAMFCLDLLRKVTHEELRMLPKSTWQFVAVKLVLFFDNFQSIFLHLLANYGAVKSTYPGFAGDEQEFATMLQNFLLCFEMVAFALFFNYAFDYRRYDVEGQPRLSIAQSFKQFWGVSNVMSNTIGRFRKRGSHANRDGNQQRTTAGSPAAQRNDAPPKGGAGQQVISMPDIIVNHVEASEHAAQIHRPESHDGRSDRVRGIDNPGYRGELCQEGSKPTEDDDASDDNDEYLDEAFPTHDDEESDNDNDLPLDGRLDGPRGLQPKTRRVKKISYAGMTFDDLDPRKLEYPGQDSSAEATKKRVKKVSYAGMTFEDMDWEQIRRHQSPTTETETVHDATGSAEQIGKKHSEGNESKQKGNRDGERFGSSEA